MKSQRKILVNFPKCASPVLGIAQFTSEVKIYIFLLCNFLSLVNNGIKLKVEINSISINRIKSSKVTASCRAQVVRKQIRSWLLVKLNSNAYRTDSELETLAIIRFVFIVKDSLLLLLLGCVIENSLQENSFVSKACKCGIDSSFPEVISSGCEWKL